MSYQMACPDIPVGLSDVLYLGENILNCGKVHQESLSKMDEKLRKAMLTADVYEYVRHDANERLCSVGVIKGSAITGWHFEREDMDAAELAKRERAQHQQTVAKLVEVQKAAVDEMKKQSSDGDDWKDSD